MQININSSNSKYNSSKVAFSNSNESNKELKKVCHDFESIFINYMMQSMRKTIPKSGFLGDSLGIDMAESMYFEVLSQELSKEQGIGLANMLYDQLSKYSR